MISNVLMIRALPTHFALPLLSLFSLGATCGPSLPAPDSCESAGDALGLVSLELGADASGAYQAWAENEIIDLVVGGQGGYMLPMTLKLEGTQLPSCIDVELEARSTLSDSAAYYEGTLRLYEDSNDAKVTSPHFLIFNVDPPVGDLLRVRASVGGIEATRSLWYQETSALPIDFSIAPLSGDAPAGTPLSYRLTLDEPAGPAGLDIAIESSQPHIQGEEVASFAEGETEVDIAFCSDQVEQHSFTARAQFGETGDLRFEHEGTGQWVANHALTASVPEPFDVAPLSLSEVVLELDSPAPECGVRVSLLVVDPDGAVETVNQELRIEPGETQLVVPVQATAQEGTAIMSFYLLGQDPVVTSVSVTTP